MSANTPERIYGWRDSHLSIARFYGACVLNGARYVVAPDEDGEPLVREDVLRKKRAALAKAAPQENAQRQARMFA